MADKRSVKRTSFQLDVDMEQFLQKCREKAQKMTSPSDIVLLLTSDGADWADYLSKRLDAFPKVTHSCIIVNQLEYENPPEVTQACRDSTVLLLLATASLLDYMGDKAGWFCKTLQEVPSKSAVVVITLLDKQEMDEVTTTHKYVTSEWKYFDPGYHETEVVSMVAQILDIVERCQRDKKRLAQGEQEQQEASTPEAETPKHHGRGSPSPPHTRAPKSGVQLIPSTVYHSNEVVAVIFMEEVKRDVSLKVGNSEKPLNLKKMNPCVYTFDAPELPPGSHSVNILVDGKKYKRLQLAYHSVVYHSTHYLCQCLNVHDLSALDQKLHAAFTASMPADSALETVFQMLPNPDASAPQTKSDELYPTLLHYAAAHGLSEFCSALLDCPGSTRAFRVLNKDGHDPADIAENSSFDELAEYINDFMECQTADEVYGHYVAMNPPEAEANPAEEDDYSSVTDLHPGGLPPKPRVEEAGDTDPSKPDPGRLNRPPQPPPRARAKSAPTVTGATPKRTNSERFATPLPTVQEHVGRNTQSLPRGMNASMMMNPDPEVFMGMKPGQTLPPDLHKGAMGSRGQSELIDIYEMFKSGEINQNEAKMFFNSWHDRYGRKSTASFKDKQKELKKIKSEYMQVRDKQGKTGQGFLGFFKRDKQETIKVNITDPVLKRESHKKLPKVYNRSASDSNLQPGRESTASNSSTGSSASSRDSGWSQGSRESSMSTTVPVHEEDSEEDEAFIKTAESGGNVQSRRLSSSSSTHRLSLGQQFVQQLEAQGDKVDTTAARPPLPPRRRRSQTDPPRPAAPGRQQANRADSLC